ncbi:MBL fold metallo-hydrolase [Candidatus Omnitrophota bacterium]
MKVHFLGTNGWFDTSTGNTICTLIETDSCYIILDAGNGMYKAQGLIKKNKPTYLFLSHFHLDHIIGLHLLVAFNFKKGLRIYGQKGTRSVVRQITNSIYTASIKKLRYKVSIHELSEGTHRVPFEVTCKSLVHVSKCLGFRFKLEDKIIAYCTDTGFCDNAVALAKHADLLITECAFLPGQSSKGWPHLNPASAARIAKKANAKRLLLTHFDAWAYRTLQQRRDAQRHACKIFQKTSVAFDNQCISV